MLRKISIGIFGLAIIIATIFLLFTPVTTEAGLSNGTHVKVTWSNAFYEKVVELTHNDEDPPRRLHFELTPEDVIVTEYHFADGQWDEGHELERMTLAEYKKFCKKLR